MIAGLTGNIIEKVEGRVIVESGCFRFYVFCPRTVTELVEIGEKVIFHTHLNVREDDLSLFGFLNKNQLGLFRHLISVSGIGPKIALEILSAGEQSVQQAIVAEDVSFLQSIKGIGKKTAERAILELREKVEVIPSVNISKLQTSESFLANEEAIDALIGLGWKKTDIQRILKNAPKELYKAEEIIKWFLTNS